MNTVALIAKLSSNLHPARPDAPRILLSKGCYLTAWPKDDLIAGIE